MEQPWKYRQRLSQQQACLVRDLANIGGLVVEVEMRTSENLVVSLLLHYRMYKSISVGLDVLTSSSNNGMFDANLGEGIR